MSRACILTLISEKMITLWTRACGKNRCKIVLGILFLLVSIFLAYICVWLLTLPPSLEKDFEHFRRSRNLAHYLDNIQVLIEPSSTLCATSEEIPLIILVATAPDRFEARQAVRQTWAQYQPTFFVLGLPEYNVNEKLVDYYLEAKQYSDMIIFGFRDHYQNLTLKSALMMQWTLCRCPQVRFMMKTDDDVLVNPWTLKNMLRENNDAVILGHRRNDSPICQKETCKWHLPNWMYESDVIPQYVAGFAYFIKGKYLQEILKTAFKVPLINLEDVYFTYLIAHKTLGLNLTHDHRVSLYKPYIDINCIYSRLATAHTLEPGEMISVWTKIKSIANRGTVRYTCRVFLIPCSISIYFYIR